MSTKFAGSPTVPRSAAVFSLFSSFFASALLACLPGVLFPGSLRAQTPQVRIAGLIADSARVALPDSRPPRALPANDTGPLDPATQIEGMNLVFRRSAAQEADLQSLLAAQQDATSPQYHQWLDPDQFAARFGMADADLNKAEGWLQAQGFTVMSVGRGHDRITFSGTAAQFASAFGAELHHFAVDGKAHFAPAADLSLPASLANVVSTVANTSDFRPHPHARLTPHPAFTSSQTGNHFLTPKDVATIYDINPALIAGYTGAGQTIAVVGQSAILATDITKFQSAAGLTVQAPTVTLEPGTGTSTVYSGDEGESDLDVEYSGALAQGATIDLVYVGSNPAYAVFDAMSYAISNRIGTVISVSYGECEADLGASMYATYNATLAQAAAQGQSVIAASGDEGSEGCGYDYGETGVTSTYASQVVPQYPASSQYATAIGGTEFSTANVATTNTQYWIAASGADVIGSAKSYIPEVVWNDDAPFSSPTDGVDLSASTGGVSTMTPRPSWQTGVPGIGIGSLRLIPDISLDASDANAPYLVCSSDVEFTPADGGVVIGSCSNGFRDSSNTNLTALGGTSVGTPIFAGLLAVINQARGYIFGQGVANNTLYALASNPGIYAASFHDITSGTNACPTAIVPCSAAASADYPAGVGYDLATGLGSIDFFSLLQVWPTTATASLAASSVTVIAATSTPAYGAADTISIGVSATSGSGTPTGTVSIAVDGNTVSSAVALTAGAANYTFSSLQTGTHTVAVTYPGSTVFAPSANAVTLTVLGVPSTTSVSAASLSVGDGVADAVTIRVATGSSSITSVPSGTVSISVDGTVVNSALALLSGAASYSFSSTATGVHAVTVTYSGDGTFAASTGSVSITTTVAPTFAISATAVTVSAGSTGTSTITVTPSSAYTGTVAFAVTPSVTFANACYKAGTATVSNTAAATATLTIYTSASACTTAGGVALERIASGAQARSVPPAGPGDKRPYGRSEAPAALALASLFAGVWFGARRKARRLPALLAILLFGLIGFGVSGCGGSSSTVTPTPPSTNAPTGTYTLTLRGTDTASTLSSSTTVTLTVQ